MGPTGGRVKGLAERMGTAVEMIVLESGLKKKLKRLDQSKLLDHEWVAQRD